MHAPPPPCLFFAVRVRDGKMSSHTRKREKSGFERSPPLSFLFLSFSLRVTFFVCDASSDPPLVYFFFSFV